MFRDVKQKHDGLILIGKCSQKGLKTLKRYEKNLISINRNSTTYEVDEVLCDGRKIALTAVNYLISCGHQKIGYVGDCHNETRYIGYQEALVHHGIAPDIDDVYDITSNEKMAIRLWHIFAAGNTAQCILLRQRYSGNRHAEISDTEQKLVLSPFCHFQ